MTYDNSVYDVVRVTKLNELYVLLEAEYSTLLSIKEHFTFYAKGYKYHPKYKHGLWDGRISMLASNGMFYIGLMSELMSYCKSQKVTIEVTNPEAFKTKIKWSDDWFEQYKKNSVAYTLYDDQENSVKHAIRYNKSLVLSPTGSGKSIIIYTIVRFLLENTESEILINVPSVSLVEQLYSDFEDYVTDEFCVSDVVHKSYNNTKSVRTKNTRVTIQTWQTTSKLSHEELSVYDAYICDEAHGASAKELTKIIDGLAHCQFRLGLTGTLDGTDMHTLAMTGRFGIIYKEVTTSMLVSKGTLADFSINVSVLDYPLEIAKTINKLSTTYQQEIDFITQHSGRNKYLCNLALSKTSNTLMIFNYVEKHGQVIYDLLKPKLSSSLKEVYYVHGDIKGTDREVYRKEIESVVPVWYDHYLNDTQFIRLRTVHTVITPELFDEAVESYAYTNISELKSDQNVVNVVERTGSCILLASYGTASVGLNIKNLHSLIFCHPRKSPISVLQTIGRVIRKADGKSKVVVHDIGDKLLNKKGSPNFTYRHVTARIEIYEASKFNYDVSVIDYNNWSN